MKNFFSDFDDQQVSDRLAEFIKDEQTIASLSGHAKVLEIVYNEQMEHWASGGGARGTISNIEALIGSTIISPPSTRNSAEISF